MANENAPQPDEPPMVQPDNSNQEPPADQVCGPTVVTDELPSKEILQQAMGKPVLDINGVEQPFRMILCESLFADTQRILVIFIRHFFCGSCQEYIRSLVSSIPTPESLPAGTQLIIIGCGSPSLISMYAKTTGCPYPLYTDPKKHLFSLLGMNRSLSLGQKPQYIQRSFMSSVIGGIRQALKRVSAGDAHKSGDIAQVGGEFLFEKDYRESLEGKPLKVTWCHRMKNTRDHTEIPALRKIMGFDS